MDNPVVIKGNKHGITVLLDAKLDFGTLKELVAEKFRDSSKFLGQAPVILGFEGRPLLPEQEVEMLDIINANCNLKVVMIDDHDTEREERYKKQLDEVLMEIDRAQGAFYKGNLRSGQEVFFESSVVVLGDVHPGASVISKGNVIILGSLKGQVAAGAYENENAFVFATEMSPVMIQIAGVRARCSDEPGKNTDKGMKLAFLEEGRICLEPLSKKIWNDIRL